MDNIKKMIQSKAKNKYWQAGKRWKKVWTFPTEFSMLDFISYDYIIGDKIYTEPNKEAEEAFNRVLMWRQLHD